MLECGIEKNHQNLPSQKREAIHVTTRNPLANLGSIQKQSPQHRAMKLPPRRLALGALYEKNIKKTIGCLVCLLLV